MINKRNFTQYKGTEVFANYYFFQLKQHTNVNYSFCITSN